MRTTMLRARVCVFGAAKHALRTWCVATLAAGASFAQTCAPDTQWVAADNLCAPVIHKYRNNKPALTCSGQGICPATGSYRYTLSLGAAVGARELFLVYDSARQGVATVAALATNNFGDAPSFGPLWFSNLHRKLAIKSNAREVTAFRGSGVLISFELVNGVYVADPDVNDTLVAIAGGYQLIRADTGSVESYNPAGQLTSLAEGNGALSSFFYSSAAGTGFPAAGYLSTMTDNNGRSIQFAYTLPAGGNPALDGKVSSLTDPAGRVTAFEYDAAGNLTNVIWPGNASSQFQYTNASLPWALTAVLDENAQSRASISYDAQGAALEAIKNGGVKGSTVYYKSTPLPVIKDYYDSVSKVLYRFHEWADSSGASVMDAAGTMTSFSWANVVGIPSVVHSSNSVGSSVSSTNRVLDPLGNVLVNDDAQGHRQCMSYDTRNRHMARIDGLSTTVDCTSLVSAGAALPSGARRVTFEWHPDWRMPSKVSAPGSVALTVYHGQPDPLAAGATANCTSAPNMPNGKPLPLVCKTAVQATLADGTLDASVPVSVQRFVYDASGRPTNWIDAAGKTTTFTYYSNTSFASGGPDALGHTLGDLNTVTTPLSFVTTLAQYDRNGRVRQSVSAKNVVTDFTYSPRGWPLTTTVTAPGLAAMTTSANYDPTGFVISQTGADGIGVQFSRDFVNGTATQIDPLGSKLVSTFDANRNLIDQQIISASGVVHDASSMSYDARARMQMRTVKAVNQAAVALPVVTPPTVASSNNPSVVGESVTLTANVTGTNLTGTVTFKVGSAPLGSASIVNGVATLSTSFSSAGNRSVVAYFNGDVNNPPIASSAFTQIVQIGCGTGCIIQ